MRAAAGGRPSVGSVPVCAYLLVTCWPSVIPNAVKTAPWCERVERLQREIRALRDENGELKATVAIYAQVFDDLNAAVHEAETRSGGTLRLIR